MWSSSTLKPAPPFIWGPFISGERLELWVTRATLARGLDSSTPNPLLFADSRRDTPGTPRRGRCARPDAVRSGQPVTQGAVHGGMVEQPEVVGPADVQHGGAREQLGAVAVPAVRRRHPHEHVPDDVPDGV